MREWRPFYWDDLPGDWIYRAMATVAMLSVGFAVALFLVGLAVVIFGGLA